MTKQWEEDNPQDVRLNLTFTLGNDAFYHHKELETARILREVADKVQSGVRLGTVRDYNGNKVGQFTLE